MNSVAQLTDDTPTVSQRLVALVREWEDDHEGYAAPLSHLAREMRMPMDQLLLQVDRLVQRDILRWRGRRAFGERDVASGPVSL